MLRFIIFIILSISAIFLDFLFELKGVLYLFFCLCSLIFYYRSLDKSYFNFNNFLLSKFLIYGLVIIISLSLLNDFVINYFYYLPVKNENKISVFFIIYVAIISIIEEIIFRGYWLNKFIIKFN